MSRPSLKETAYEAIRGRIASGQLPEGAVTSENALSALLDMSRTPIRAALQQLEQEGYLRIAPKHGILILPASAQRITDLLETLTALLLFVYEQYRQTKPGELTDAVQAFASELDRAAADKRTTPEALAELERSLWLRLLSIGHNREIARIGQTTLDRLQWSVNCRRWRPPYRSETERLLREMADTMLRPPEGSTSPCWFSYLRLLKQTWS